MNNYIIKLLIVALPFMMIGCSISQSKKNSDYRVVVTDESTVAQTIYGAIQGYRDGDVFTFKGIPYAQAERFMPPTAPEKHNDTLKCRLYGPKAPQMESLEWKGINQTDYAFGNQFVYEPMDEKGCIVLNVWTKGLNDGKKRPVFVWIHGGGYFAGSGHDLPCYEGWALAEKGDIVTLTLNHRLNILGYSDLTALGGKYENSVNLGMQDIVMALKWVHDNITNFGGDPNNVTIGGQSGGGGKVSTLLAMPSAHGLFHKAIIQSGSTLTQTEPEQSRALGLAMLEELGVNAKNADKLLDSFTYEQLLDASNKAVQKLAKAGDGGRRMMGGSPVVDGNILPTHPFSPAAPEISKDIPVIIGTDFNEFSFENTPLTMEEATKLLKERYGEKTDDYIAAFKKMYPEKTPREMVAIDLGFRKGAIRQAELKSRQKGAPIYHYLFTWQPTTNVLAASHGMELPFMFNNVALQPEMTGNTAEAHALENIMSNAWIQFIKTGDPNHEGMPKWEPFTEENPVYMIFDNECKMKTVDADTKALMEFGKPIF